VGVSTRTSPSGTVRRSFPLLSALALLVVVSGCAPDDADLGPAATVGTAPTSVPTTARPIDVAVIPDDPADIDEAYVQAVVDALFAVDAKATEVFVETRQLDEDGIAYLEAIYIGDELDQQIEVWSETLNSEDLLAGALEHDVTRLIQVFDDCVYFAAQRSFAMTSSAAVPPRIVYLGISPKPVPTDAPLDRNPTAWMLFTDGFNLDGSQPEDACGAA
jgi:hypothetical protein